MQITGYLHTAILVSDLQKAEWFYGEVLGLDKVERPMKFPGTWYQIGPAQLHLIVSETVSTPLASEKWGRNPHVAFAIADLDSTQQRLADADCPMQMSASGRPALFTRDPDGNIIELSAA
jgi:catechol 2,3-dioxygenase-like lactoylglutathione lyase family enzyme